MFVGSARVELGQLAVVLLCWPLLLALARVRQGALTAAFRPLAVAATGALGVFWFASRALASQ